MAGVLLLLLRYFFAQKDSLGLWLRAELCIRTTIPQAANKKSCKQKLLPSVWVQSVMKYYITITIENHSPESSSVTPF